ncbi:bacteriophage spanin2 family protein [Actinosynnema pretiosum subsp. pretiosum]|uniref:Secreted protein n=2 Tax=Actinosynnema TaxID=40566 RepID=C6WLQ4_ACTMD|nr:bacteriophage spanin2 family protein [Actinosynnema mirum]ACU40289.1 hypothetical protein Amir_6488 [Actinosynnema mirum DSM 43827]AXX33802.1 hypothetical protein APASM_6437 [Actinosynnema pretiosum subsp. pretiosum]QUF02434.1 bacteriophage spanin2 family protein [Actinosynnema pretiosum subsp. pretiosum]
MRARRTAVTFLLALGVIGSLSACESVQQANEAVNDASQALDKVTLCTEALALAGFTPDATDPQKALEETQKKAEELGALADKSADTTLREAIEGVSTTMEQVTLQDLSPSSIAEWSQEKLDRVARLTSACA